MQFDETCKMLQSEIVATFEREVHLSSPQITNGQKYFIKYKPPAVARWDINGFKKIYFEFWLVCVL